MNKKCNITFLKIYYEQVAFNPGMQVWLNINY